METDEEWEFIKNETQHKRSQSNNEWHIGLMRKVSGNWIWVNGKPLTIKRWQPGKPDDNPTETVAVIAQNYPRGKHGLFNNVDTDNSRGYICERVRNGKS